MPTLTESFIKNPHADLAALERKLDRAATEELGFLDAWSVAAMAGAEAYRLTPVLLRYHEVRFVCPAWSVAGLVAACDALGYVLRDVSLPADVCDRVKRHGARILQGAD